MDYYLITPMVFLPLLGAALQGFAGQSNWGRWAALATSLASSIFALTLVALMDAKVPGLQANETLSWISSYSISYDMGVDGLNILMVILIATAFPILIASEWTQKVSPRGIHGLLLVLQTALLGTVCAQDSFLQFVFWGLSALPFYFLIGIRGGEERESVAFRAIISASIGNALVFAALLLVYYAVDPHTFSLRELAGGKIAGKFLALGGVDINVPVVALALIGAGLAFRAPIWPLHGWFTHVARYSPPSILVVQALTGIVAIHLFLRLGLTLFPEVMVEAGPSIVVVGAVNLVIAGLCAVAQKDLRLLLAYVCLGEFGLALVGCGALSAPGMTGVVYQLLVLGLGITGFGLFAAIVDNRAGHVSYMDHVASGRSRELGGIAQDAPALALVTGIVLASLLGFPGLAGFVGHAMIIIGGFTSYPWAIGIAGFALLLATYFLFTMYRRVFLGKSRGDGFADLTGRERAFFLPLILAIVVLGFYPKPLLDLVSPTVTQLLGTAK